MVVLICSCETPHLHKMDWVANQSGRLKSAARRTQPHTGMKRIGNSIESHFS